MSVRMAKRKRRDAPDQERGSERRPRTNAHASANNNTPLQPPRPARVNEHPHPAPSTDPSSPDSPEHSNVTLRLGVLQVSELPGSLADRAKARLQR